MDLSAAEVLTFPSSVLAVRVSVNGRWVLVHLIETVIHTFFGFLEYQIPDYEERTECTSTVKHQPGRTRPLARSLQLLVALSHVLRGQERVLNELVDIGRLLIQVHC